MGIPQLIGLSLLAIGAGCALVMQQAVNADLRVSLGSAAWAGFVSYFGGTSCMLILAFAMRDALPSAATAGKSPWLAWTGGFWGTIYIAVSIFLVPRLGTATFVALLVGGQMLSSLLFDHYGLFGLPEHPADLTRIAGAVLLLAGVVLVRL
jgi:bacterial/archaeal transporter family-2 protein